MSGSLFDEIWSRVPAGRPLHAPALALALEVVREAPGRHQAPPRVLDLGCGDGRVAAELAKAGAAVTGVDPSTVALERARRAHPDLELVEPLADGTLPFGEGHFDAVVCLHVLEHVADTQLALSEAHRVLAPGGLIGVTVPWHGRVRNVLYALRGFEAHFDPLQPVLRFYTRRSLGGLLDALGFDVLELRAEGGRPLARETLLAKARRA